MVNFFNPPPSPPQQGQVVPGQGGTLPTPEPDPTPTQAAVPGSAPAAAAPAAATATPIPASTPNSPRWAQAARPLLAGASFLPQAKGTASTPGSKKTLLGG